jgi:hypothetical protein
MGQKIKGLRVICFLVISSATIKNVRGSLVVEALCYKPEGRRLLTRRGKLIFSMYLILPAALGPGVYSACNRNMYKGQKNNVSGE